VAGDDADRLRTELASANDRRLAAVRQRSSAATALLELEEELRRARAAVEQARSQYASTVIAAFRERWDRCCGELGALHAEAQRLAKVLHSDVSCPAPYCVALDMVTQRAEVRLIASAEPVTVELPPGLAALAALRETTLHHVKRISSCLNPSSHSFQRSALSFAAGAILLSKSWPSGSKSRCSNANGHGQS
jgi:hypothetical protein